MSQDDCLDQAVGVVYGIRPRLTGSNRIGSQVEAFTNSPLQRGVEWRAASQEESVSGLLMLTKRVFTRSRTYHAGAQTRRVTLGLSCDWSVVVGFIVR